MKHKRINIYVSAWHLAATIFIVVLPFLFLLLFSRLANIAFVRLLTDVGVSFWRLLIAYVIALVIAWILATSFFRGKRATIALPLFDVLQSFPTFAALPLAVYLWGPSNTTVIFFLVLTIIWPILFSIVSTLKLMKRDWEEVAEIYQLKRLNYIRLFLLPSSIPGIVTGSMIGLGEGWEALVATEIIVNLPQGLGGFFQSFAHNATITVFGILGFLVLIFSINKLVWFPLLEWSHRKMEE